MPKENKSETYQVKGEDLLKKVKDLIHEGNVRSITIKDKSGNILAQFPLTFGVVGTLIAPALAAVGAIAALVTECSITIERRR